MLRFCLSLLFGLGLASHSLFVQADESSGAEQQTAVFSALSMGTGWAVTRQHVVTNYHVVANSRNLRLVKPSGEEIPVKVVLVDQINDLAILALDTKHSLEHPLPLALTRPKLGSSVFTIGYPHPNLLGTNPKLTTGHINAMSGLADDPRTYQVSVPVQIGNSGGPLINLRGEVVGIITSKLSAKKMFDWTGDVPQNVNYAVKVTALSNLLSNLETEHPVKAGSNHKQHSIEDLAENIIDSVVIVAGDALNKPASNTAQNRKKNQMTARSNPEKQTHIVIYSFTEPGFYDENERLPESNTTNVFSENTAKTLKQSFLKRLNEHAKVSLFSGNRYKNIYTTLESPRKGKALCERHNADKIVASQSYADYGAHFRSVYYRIFDCDTQREFAKQYVIYRDERYDKFGYENDFISSFTKFIDLAPRFLKISKR